MTRLVALFGLLLAPLVTVNSAPIRVAGSDLLAEAIGGDLGEFAKKNDLDVAIDMRGSRLGLEALQSGQADFALLAFGPHDAQPGPEFTTRVAGYMTAVLVVPAELPLTQVTYPQLAGVYGASEVNNFKRWSDLNVRGEWGGRTITAVAITRRVGLSIDLFRLAVLQTPEFKPTVLMFDDQAKALTRLGAADGGLALVSVPPENPGLKVLLVAKAPGDVAYGPTPENLHSGDYPLRLPVHLVLRKESAPKLNFLLRRLLSDESAPAWSKAGLVPLPVQARNQLVFDLENMR